jgi:hypothetical protein
MNIDRQLDLINWEKRRLARVQASGQITYYKRKQYEKKIFETFRLDTSMSNLERVINTINLELSNNLNYGHI